MDAVLFTLNLLRKDLKNFIFYILSSIMSFLVLFTVFNIMFDPIILNEIAPSNKFFFSNLNIIIITLILVIGYYTNLFFMENRKKEIAIELVSGLSVYSIGTISFFINSLTSVISVISAFIIGSFTSPIINGFIYNSLGIENGIFSITLDGVISTCTMIFINVTLFVLLNVGLGFRNEIVNLIRSKNGTFIFKRKKNFFTEKLIFLKSKTFIFLGLLLPLCMGIFSSTPEILELISLIFPFGIALMNIELIPEVFRKLGFETECKIKTIVFKNIAMNITKSLAIIFSAAIISAFISGVLSTFTKDFAVSISALISILFLTLLFVIGLFYSFYSLAHMKKRNFKILQLLGYTYNERKKIIALETFIFIFGILALPFIEMIIFSFKYYFLGTIPLYLLIGVLLSFLFIMLLSEFICYKIYKKIVLK